MTPRPTNSSSRRDGTWEVSWTCPGGRRRRGRAPPRGRWTARGGAPGCGTAAGWGRWGSASARYRGDPAALAHRLCDRRRGVGADGLILVLPPSNGDAHCRMVIYNADGSRAEMCGNGIRGLAKFVHDRGFLRASPLRVETDAGVKTVHTEVANGRVVRVTVDMGLPVWAGRASPVASYGAAVEGPLEAAGRTRRVAREAIC